MPIPHSDARGFRGACLWVLLTLLYCVLSTTPAPAAELLPFDTPATVSFDADRLQLDISNIDHQWLLQLTPKRLLGNSSVLNDALLDLPHFFDGVVNGVDGLYQSQLGLAVVVDRIRVYDDPAQDPLRNFQGSVNQILEAYREIRINDEELPADLALVHLFSGHDDPAKIVGLGWIDTACRLDGYDMSVSTPFPYDMLLSAHEIAHNLGAEHDDGAACVTDNAISGSEIMWSELSGGTQPLFSSCSIIKMKPALTSACVTDNIDVGVDLKAPF